MFRDALNKYGFDFDSYDKKGLILGNRILTFIIKHRADKTARNISKNTTVIIPTHDIPVFKPAKEFMDQVKG